MSWAEVMKSLNKRKDKALNEIIEEPEQRTGGGMALASGKYTTSGTVLKIEGKGRLYYFAFHFNGKYGYTCEFKIVIDGKVVADVKKIDTAESGTRLFRVVSYNHHTPRDREGYLRTIYTTDGGSDTLSVDSYPNATGAQIVKNTSGNAFVGLMIPEFLLFNEYAEVIVTFTGNMSDATLTSYNYATLGYKLD